MSTKKQKATNAEEEIDDGIEYGDMSREALERDIALAGTTTFDKRYEPYLKEKQRAGLDKHQAIAVIVSQIKEDFRAGSEPTYKPLATEIPEVLRAKAST